MNDDVATRAAEDRPEKKPNMLVEVVYCPICPIARCFDHFVDAYNWKRTHEAMHRFKGEL